MEYSTSSLLALVSHVHSLAADFLQKRLSEKGLESLASSHGFILFCLSQNNSMLMGELSQKINRDKSTTTVLVRKLENLGFVKIEKSETDSRKKIISLTAKGAEYNKITAEISAELMTRAFKDFGENEKQNLVSELKRVSDNLS